LACTARPSSIVHTRCDLAGHRNTALRPAPRDAQDYHDLSPQVDELFRNRCISEVLFDLRDEVLDALEPLDCAAGESRFQLEVGVQIVLGQRRYRLRISPRKRRVGGAQPLHVLLRHRPRSISRQTGGRSGSGTARHRTPRVARCEKNSENFPRSRRLPQSSGVEECLNTTCPERSLRRRSVQSAR
jgi:hypothetical protein